MNLSQFTKIGVPYAFWRMDRYGDGNVYDELDNTTLINDGAMLGQPGSSNPNLSSESINLKSGYLYASDPLYLNDRLLSKNLEISFNLKVEDEVQGLKPIVSKWFNDDQFFIGFENGNITFKIQTEGGGVSTLTWTNKDIIYSGRWNRITFIITGSSLHIRANGGSQIGNGTTDSTNSYPIILSGVQPFRVGGVGENQINSDVWINDLIISNYYSGYKYQAEYMLTRSDNDRWLDLCPDYFFDIASAFKYDKSAPVINQGTMGPDIVGYLGGANIDDFLLWTKGGLMNEDVVVFPTNGYFTIDAPLTFDFSVEQGTVFLFDGYINWGSSNSYITQPFYPIYIKENIGSDIWRFQSRIGAYYNRLRFWTQTWDGSGSPLANSYAEDGDGLDFKTYGLKAFKYGTGQPKESHIYYYQNALTATNNIYTMGGYLPPADLEFNYNKFWLRTSSDSRDINDNRLTKFAIFKRGLSDNEVVHLNYPRNIIYEWMKLYYYGFNDASSKSCVTNTDPMRHWQRGYNSVYADYEGSYTTHGYIEDPLHNRENSWIGTVELAGTGNYFRNRYYEDANVGTRNFVVSAFIKNKNFATSYSFFRYHYQSARTIYSALMMNQKDGAFSHGDCEFIFDYVGGNAAYRLSTSSGKLTDDGFHLVTVVRNGLTTEIWIDGELEVSLVTPTVYSMGTADHTWGVYGGPCDVNEFFEGSMSGTIYPNFVEYLFNGYHDVIKGQTVVDGVPTKSKLFSLNETKSGVEIRNEDVTNDVGKFRYKLPKNEQEIDRLFVAYPHDPSDTNNVIVHGPYTSNVPYKNLTEEVFEESLEDLILDMEPLAYYPLNDLSGTTIVDASGNTGNGTISGTSYLLNQDAMEPGSKSVYFDGVDTFIDLPDGFVDFTNGLTFEVWGKPTSTASYARFLEIASAADGHDGVLLCRHNTTTGIYAALKDTDGTDFGNISKTNILELSVWKHYVFRVRPDLTTELFVNGQLVGTSTTTSLPNNVIRGVNYIGKSTFASNSYYQGNMSHVAVYDYSLPDEDILNHANRGFLKSATTMKSLIEYVEPVAYWTFDRLKTATDEITDRQLSEIGTINYEKNAVVINSGTPANNYLFDSTLHLDSTAFTLECSFRSLGDHAEGILISEWTEITNTGTFKIVLEPTGILKCYVGTSATFLVSSILYNDYDWHHLVITGEPDNFTLWIDGVVQDTLLITPTFNLHRFTIGNDDSADVDTFLDAETHIDDLAVYDKVLLDVRITEHYDQFIKKKGTL